ncbi:MAG: class I SAM-dependent methyltransferase [Chloroflexota bacterium]|nr:class I SAM-dependent methyltransferase [Chloroflexota bacterium]
MASNGVVEAFTALAARYEEEMDRELRMLWGVGYDAFVARLTELAAKAPGGRVLDVATGTARIPAAMADGSDGTGRIAGLDITWRMLTHGAEAPVPGRRRRQPSTSTRRTSGARWWPRRASPASRYARSSSPAAPGIRTV